MCWDICEQFRIIARIGRKEERERERKGESARVSAWCSFRFAFFPFVFFGSLCTEFCWTIDTRRVVFRRFYLRLPTANVRGRYYGWLGSPWFRIHTTIFLTFFPRVLVRDDGKGKKKMIMAEEARPITHWARAVLTWYIFSVKKSFVLTRPRLLIDAEQHKITIFRLRNYIYMFVCVCCYVCERERICVAALRHHLWFQTPRSCAIFCTDLKLTQDNLTFFLHNNSSVFKHEKGKTCARRICIN